MFPEVDPEMGLPLLVKNALPIGVTGIVIAAYFSAIMSTADSCLIASSGNFVNDIIERFFIKNTTHKQSMRISQITTLVLGFSTLLIAGAFPTVLEIILHAYGFMVAGLFVPTLAALFLNKRADANAATGAMLAGGGFVLLDLLAQFNLPFGLDAAFYGILLSALIFVIIYIYTSNREKYARQN